MRDKSGVNVKRILFSLMVLLALGTAAPAPVSASPITGILNITGSVIVGATTIDWYPPTGPVDGTFSTKSPGTEYFSTIVQAPATPATGSSLDLSAPPGPVDNFLYNFVTTDPKYSDLAFDLDGFITPVAAPCLPDHDYAVNESCSLGLFTLTQGSSGVDVRLEVFGSFEDPTFGDNGSLNIAIGRYTSQSPMLVNETGATVFSIRQVVDVIDAGQHINTSYSASFVATAVPEPATLLTFGLGTAALAVHRRRRAKKNQKV